MRLFGPAVADDQAGRPKRIPKPHRDSNAGAPIEPCVLVCRGSYRLLVFDSGDLLASRRGGPASIVHPDRVHLERVSRGHATPHALVCGGAGAQAASRMAGIPSEEATEGPWDSALYPPLGSDPPDRPPPRTGRP